MVTLVRYRKGKTWRGRSLHIFGATTANVRSPLWTTLDVLVKEPMMFVQDKRHHQQNRKKHRESIQIIIFWRCALEVVVRDGKWSSYERLPRFSILEQTHAHYINVECDCNLILRFAKMTLYKCIFGILEIWLYIFICVVTFKMSRFPGFQSEVLKTPKPGQ